MSLMYLKSSRSTPTQTATNIIKFIAAHTQTHTLLKLQKVADLHTHIHQIYIDYILNYSSSNFRFNLHLYYGSKTGYMMDTKFIY